MLYKLIYRATNDYSVKNYKSDCLFRMCSVAISLLTSWSFQLKGCATMPYWNRSESVSTPPLRSDKLIDLPLLFNPEVFRSTLKDNRLKDLTSISASFSQPEYGHPSAPSFLYRVPRHRILSHFIYFFSSFLLLMSDSQTIEASNYRVFMKLIIVVKNTSAREQVLSCPSPTD